MEEWLEGTDFIAGDEISIADLSAVCELATIRALDYDLKKHKKVHAWYERLRTIPEVAQVLEKNMKFLEWVKQKKAKL